MGAKELLEEQRRLEAAAKGTGTIPPRTPGMTGEVDNINAETARIIAETAKNKAQWELNAQLAGFKTAEDYKTALAQLSEDRALVDRTIVKWNEEKLAFQTEYDGKIAKLKAIQADFQDREKKLAEREQACQKRESVLDEAQNFRKAELEKFQSDKSVLARNATFIRNRLVKLCNQFWVVGDAYGDVLSKNIRVIDKQITSDISLNGHYESLLANLRIMVSDTYNATVGLMASNRPPDTSLMVNCFDEMSRNESWRLVVPPKWIPD